MLHYGQYHIIATIQNYHKTACELVRSNALYSNIDGVASGQVRIEGHLSTNFA